MTYLATSINQSPVIVDKAGVDIEDVRGKAVKFDDNGAIVLAGAGDAPLGVGILTNDKKTAAGEDVYIQIKDIGHVRTGAAIKKGAELAPDANGKFIPAAAGFVAAIALEAAEAADVYIKARLVTYKKSGSGVAVNGTIYATAAEAIAAAEEGATVILASDSTIEETLVIDKSLTINLNGNTLNAATDIWAKSGTVTIKNGTVKAPGTSAAFVVGDYFGSDKATGDCELVIEEDATVVVTGDDATGIYVRSGEYNARVVTGGTIIVPGANSAAIQGNGSAKGDVMVIGGRVVCENGTGIYHPQDGLLVISGGEVTGKVGVEIRAGELIVTGGTINGTVEGFSGLTANGNGTTDVYGAAIAVSQHTTNKALAVNISGGVMTGYYALYEEDIQDEVVDGISIVVTGGTFNGKVSSENVTGFISGGKFAEPVTAEQCADGKTPATEPDETGYYTVA